MKYEMQTNLPGIDGFDRKGEPIGKPPIIEKFDARSHTEARLLAAAKFKASGLDQNSHYNVSIA